MLRMESLEMVEDETGCCHCSGQRCLVPCRRRFGRLLDEERAKSWSSYCRAFAECRRFANLQDRTLSVRDVNDALRMEVACHKVVNAVESRVVVVHDETAVLGPSS